MITHMFGDSSSDSRDTCGCVLILEMSTKNALTNPDYAKGTKGKKKKYQFVFKSFINLLFKL